MKKRIFLGAFAAVVLASSGLIAGEGLKSGPQVGETPGQFLPLHATGPIDLVLGYRDRRKIERLANRSGGRLRVVDAASAYFRLEPEEYEPLVLYQAIKHLLRLPDRPV